MKYDLRTFPQAVARLLLLAPLAALLPFGCSSGGSGGAVPAGSSPTIQGLERLVPGLSGHALRVQSGDREVAAPEAAVVLEDQILLSTGRASDRGLGDTDLGGDGEQDVVRLTLELDVPQGARSFSTLVSFVTSELTEGAIYRENDRAAVTLEAGSEILTQAELLSAGTMFSTESMGRCLCVDVDGQDKVTITWEVMDAGDGAMDSALVLSNLGFSKDPQPPGFHAPVTEFDVGQNISTDKLVADPVNMFTGDFEYRKQAILVPGIDLVFEFAFFYNTSRLNLETGGGPGWRHSFQWEVEVTPGDAFVRILSEDGSSDTFRRLADSRTFVPAFPDVTSTLVEELDGTLIYTSDEQVSYFFDFADRLVRIEDQAGNRILLFYDADENLRLVQDTRNNVATFSYDEFDQVTEVDYDGLLSVEVEWDEVEGRIRSIRNPDGLLSEFTYDISGRILSETENGRVKFINEYEDTDNRTRVLKQTDALGNETFINYGGNHPVFMDNNSRYIELRDGTRERRQFDQMGRLVGVYQGWVDTDPVWRYEYDSNDNQVLERDPLGNEWVGLRQNLGNLLEQEDPFGEVVQRTYTPIGDPLTSTDTAGFRSLFFYDEEDNLVREVNPMGDSVSYDHDDSGQITHHVDWNGNAWRYQHSKQGDLVAVLDPEEGLSRYEFDRLGRVVKKIDPMGRETRTTYDAADRVLSTVDPLGNTTTYEYDDFGNLLRQVDSLGVEVRKEYDDTDRPVRTIHSDGRSQSRQYDGEGNLLRETDELGRDTVHSYERGLVTRTEDAEGAVVEAEYNTIGQRTKIVDANCNEILTVRDAMGRIVETTDQNGVSTQTSYNKRGLLATTTNARGQVISMEYDGAGRPIVVRTPSQATYFVHDANGNVIHTRIERGAEVLTTRQEFDGLDRIVSRTDENGFTTRYEYNAAGFLTKLIYPGGEEARYRYDELNRLTDLEDWDGRRTTYEYAADGRVTRVSNADGSTITYAYDACRRLVAFADRDAAGQPIIQSQMTLNAANEIETETTRFPLIPQVAPRSDTYSHSPADEMTSWSRGGQVVGSFSYDLDGNLVSGPLDAPQQGAGIIPSSSFTIGYEYDLIDRLTKVLYPGGVEFTWTHDNSGNILEHEVTVPSSPTPAAPGTEEVTLSFDEENRLTTADIGGQRFANEYGMDGLRICRAVDGEKILYVYDINGNLIEERDAAGGLLMRYAYGMGLVSAETESGESLVYHFDLRGSTVALTDGQSGAITDRYAYGPFGELVARRGTTRNPFTFNGREGVVDDGTGLYYLSSRYYAPGLRRFVHRDRLYAGNLLETQSLNRYAYAFNNPISLVDPQGSYPVLLVYGAKALAGAAISAAVTFAADLSDGEVDEPWSVYAGAAVEGAVLAIVPGAKLGGGALKQALRGGGRGVLGAGLGNVTKQGVAAVENDRDFADSFDGGDFALTTSASFISGAASGGLKGYAKDYAKRNHYVGNSFFTKATNKKERSYREKLTQSLSRHKFWVTEGARKSKGLTYVALLIKHRRFAARIGLRTTLSDTNDSFFESLGSFINP